MRLFRVLFVIALCWSIAGSANPKPALLSFGSGVFNICRHNYYAQFQVEYHASYRFCQYIHPIAGFVLSIHKDLYAFGGLAADIPIGCGFFLVPSLAAGVYSCGEGKKLYYPIEFRSCLEFAYELTNLSRISAQFSHVSNASMGRRNPGAESLVISYSIPLYWSW